jgi:hypothetical protein
VVHDALALYAEIVDYVSQAYFTHPALRRADLRQGKVVQIGSQSPTQLPQVSEKAEQARRRRKAKVAA